MIENPTYSFLDVRTALEASWDEHTSHGAVKESGNPALGQCYPTSRVVQHFFPDMEIIEGKVRNGKETETHYWNGLTVGGVLYHVDLTWQQFPSGSSVSEFEILDRDTLGDSESSAKRFELLLRRVTEYLKQRSI